MLKTCDLETVRSMCERFHGYRSAGGLAVYTFAEMEEGRTVASFAWQPPPPGAALSVCPEASAGVLALSRMVAVPKEDRDLRHISKPLKIQMKTLIDRTRWPVLVTYSDEGQGHTGHVYKCSGWQKTTRKRVPVFETPEGARASRYSNGVSGARDLVRVGSTWIQRWEHRVCAPGEAAVWMADHRWIRVANGRKYRNGSPAFSWVRTT
jgi:hypothetical protein